MIMFFASGLPLIIGCRIGQLYRKYCFEQIMGNATLIS